MYKPALLLFATMLAAMSVHAASFQFNTSIPCVVGCSGSLTASGIITVDQLGSLSQANVTDWSITLISPNLPLVDLTKSNSTLTLFGSPIISATDTDLTFTMNSAVDGFAFIRNNDTFRWSGQSAIRDISIQGAQSLEVAAAPLSYPSVFTATKLLGSAEAPEPSTAGLLVVGGALIAAGVRRRKASIKRS